MTERPLARHLFHALALGLALVLAGAACGKSDDEEGKGDKANKAVDDTSASAGGDEGGSTETLTLEKVDNLKITVPKGSSAGDGIGGDGAMIQGPDLVVTVEVASATRPETAEAAKEDADMYSPENLETETLDDGWAMTFENEGSMGANYFVQVRRDIDDTSYWCETTASRPEQQKNALEACKSLTK